MLPILAVLSATPAAAADVAIYQRDMYDRLTFENVPAGDVVVNGNTLVLPFTDSMSDDERQQLISKARSLSKAALNNDRLTLTFNSAVSDSRNFRIGNKVIVDVFMDMDKLASVNNTPMSPAIPSAEDNPRLEQEPLVEETEVTATPSIDNIKTDVQPLDNETPPPAPEATTLTLREVANETAPEMTAAQTLPALAEPTIISVSSTSPFGLAVFERLGRLFVVTDQASMAIPPQVSGNGGELGWVMTQIPMQGGKAWVMPIPEGSYLRPEGRGLVWRIVMSDIDPKLDTADIRRRMAGTATPQIDILFDAPSTLLRLTDPDYGDDLAVVTVNKATARMNKAYDFVDFDILPAAIGAVVKPKSDGLRLQTASQYVTIGNANGLTIAQESQAEIVKSYLRDQGKVTDQLKKPVTTLDRVFYFSDWGGTIQPQEYIQKRKDLDNFLALAEEGNKLSVILDLVKLTLAQGMGHEALGYLNLAKAVNPQIEQASEYLALKGAAHFLAHQFDLAEPYFADNDLKTIAEAQLWLAATQAASGDEKTALQTYNDNALLTGIYPYHIRKQVLAPLTLAYLNQDQGEGALPLIDMLEEGQRNMSQEDKATVAYLKGRAQSVTGRPDEGISNLYKASTGDKLGPYGIRSELLLIQDELARNVIKPDEAIKRMERLRFSWRGDALETEIQIALGNLYIENDQPRKGLSILKRAATNTDSAQERRDIVRKMSDAYKSIFISDDFKTLDPLIAVAVYDEFKELTPVGDEGNRLIDSLADKLMSINLMSRAATVLKDKMNRLGGGENAIKSGLRIASIELLDREPEKALETLKTVDTMMAQYRGDDKSDLNNQIILRKAKAYSELGEPERALFMTEGLSDTDDVTRLRVDTAWRSGQWVAVTDNLSKLLARQNITPATPPTEQQAQLILNQAVALSLSNQYDSLQRFAQQYDTVMKQTPIYKQFLVVTRPQNISNLADRETLLDVTSEVDLFQGVLQRSGSEQDSTPSAEPESAAAQ